jgi:hypothetical protein
MPNQFHADDQGAPDSMSADIASVLAQVAFPASKDAIIDTARSVGVSNEVLTLLDGIDDQDYACADAVTDHLGKRSGC